MVVGTLYHVLDFEDSFQGSAGSLLHLILLNLLSEFFHILMIIILPPHPLHALLLRLPIPLPDPGRQLPVSGLPNWQIFGEAQVIEGAYLVEALIRYTLHAALLQHFHQLPAFVGCSFARKTLLVHF